MTFLDRIRGLGVPIMIGAFYLCAAGRGETATVDLAEGKVFTSIWLPSAEDRSPMTVRMFQGKKVLLHIFASW